MKIFNLPDLGEGLPDAEIIQWHVAEGDDIELDAALVSMETAKAVVEVPSPYKGKVSKLYGQAGDVIETGKPLAGFEVAGEAGDAEDEAGNDSPTHADTNALATPTAEEDNTQPTKSSGDAGTVVGKMEASDKLVSESLATVGGVKVTPAVRALARKLKLDLAAVTPSGKDGVVTRADVENAASNPQTLLKPSGPVQARAAATPSRATLPSGEWEPIRGTRRTMARVMSEAHAQVVPTSIMDDADVHLWSYGQDMTVRLLRSIWAGAQAEPGLNAWYDAAQNMRMIHKGMDVGMAVDTPDGLFAAALRNVHASSAADIRNSLTRLKQNVENRSIPPADLKDYTIMLSNFGMFAGRYATPVITPPCVAIIAAGKARNEVVPVLGGFEVHRTIPLSLTFDHRACTGGEAARFLRAMFDDLGLPE
ncbi:MAG: dihydrolipoamide acetyltransferase family protein [Gammaproteobacteria bacterium]|nr:MAG: dihydrolipoamide acetyltransferase family protein [Gammaproteobacteria bacterium]